MLLIGALVALAWVFSSKTIRDALPFESLLAILVVGLLCVGLFEMGRLV